MHAFSWKLGKPSLKLHFIIASSFHHWSLHASVWASLITYGFVMLIYHIPSVTVVSGEPEQMDIIYGSLGVNEYLPSQGFFKLLPIGLNYFLSFSFVLSHLHVGGCKLYSLI